jgi:hypothetical protein
MPPEQAELDAIARGDVIKPADPAAKESTDEISKTEAETAAKAVAAAEEKDSLTDEETAEEKAEREAAEAEEAKKSRIRIPKQRFDEAMSKAKTRELQLQRQIDALEKDSAGKTKKTELTTMQTEINDLQDKYEDLILEGKKDEARAVRKEVEAKREELFDRRTTSKSEAAQRSAVEELKYDSALARHEGAHAAINPDSDSFDEDVAGEVSELLEAFVTRGFTRYAALDKAVKYVLGDAKTASGKKDTEETDTIRAQRAAEARRKAADAATKQAPSTGNIGKDSDKGGQGAGGADINVMKLSQEKFAELTDEQLSTLRGDTV